MYFPHPMKKLIRVVLAISFAALTSGWNSSPIAHTQEQRQVDLDQFDLLTTTSGWVLLGDRLFRTAGALYVAHIVLEQETQRNVGCHDFPFAHDQPPPACGGNVRQSGIVRRRHSARMDILVPRRQFASLVVFLLPEE